MTLAAILAAHWERFARTHRHALRAVHYRAARAVMACRTAALGGQRHHCAGCGHEHFVFHSCHHRACPRCGGRDQQHWAQTQQARCLPVPHFLLTFTVPATLHCLAYRHPALFHDALFAAVAETLHAFGADRRHLGGTVGFTAVLHTWTRQMLYHPHLHVLLPGVALRGDGLRLYRTRGRKWAFPHKALADAFRHRLLRHLRLRKVDLTDVDPGTWTKRWVVDTRAVGNGQAAIRYLARYVKKSALTESRLKGYDAQGRVRLNCQDSTTGKWHEIALTPDEFLRRWCLHVLPTGFMRVRHYGFLSAAAKAKLQRLHDILGSVPLPQPPPPPLPVQRCPRCGTELTPGFILRPTRHGMIVLHPARPPPPRLA
jgi:hypothetical protein